MKIGDEVFCYNLAYLGAGTITHKHNDQLFEVQFATQTRSVDLRDLVPSWIEEKLTDAELKDISKENIRTTDGIKFDDKKPDMSLIPMAAAFEEAAVWTFGKRKYDAWNWYKGLPYSKILSALERHLTLLKAGQDFDYENGLHNAAAIRCCAAMLIQFTVEDRKELDDRIPMSKENKDKMDKLAQGFTIKDLLENKNVK